MRDVPPPGRGSRIPIPALIVFTSRELKPKKRSDFQGHRMVLSFSCCRLWPAASHSNVHSSQAHRLLNTLLVFSPQ